MCCDVLYVIRVFAKMELFSLEDSDYNEMFITQNCSQTQPLRGGEGLEYSQEAPIIGKIFDTNPEPKTPPPVYEDISDVDDFELSTSPPLPNRSVKLFL